MSTINENRLKQRERHRARRERDNEASTLYVLEFFISITFDDWKFKSLINSQLTTAIDTVHITFMHLTSRKWNTLISDKNCISVSIAKDTQLHLSTQRLLNRLKSGKNIFVIVSSPVSR